MHWTHTVFEFVTYGLFLLMAFHAWFLTDAVKLLDEPRPNRPATAGLLATLLHGLPVSTIHLLKPPAREALAESDLRNRGRWLATLVVGAVFGVAIEYAMISTPNASGSHNYEYGEFHWMLGNPFAASLPSRRAWGFGWGVILYAATWSAQRVKQQPLVRALFAALLAVNIDLSLDPVAEALDFWRWNMKDVSAGYYHVPYDNFVNWLSIVFLYTGAVRLLFRRFENVRASTLWVPPLAAAISLGLAWLVSEGLQRLYGLLDSQRPVLIERPIFMIVFLASTWAILRWGARPVKNLALSWLVLAVPLLLPFLAYVLIFATGKYSSDALCSLLVTVPLTAALGFLGYTWGSWDFIIARAEHDGRNHADG